MLKITILTFVVGLGVCMAQASSAHVSVVYPGTGLRRMEAFNVFNRVEFGSPNVHLSSPTFSQILAVSNTTPVGSGSARRIQLAARFTF